MSAEHSINTVMIVPTEIRAMAATVRRNMVEQNGGIDEDIPAPDRIANALHMTVAGIVEDYVNDPIDLIETYDGEFKSWLRYFQPKKAKPATEARHD